MQEQSEKMLGDIYRKADLTEKKSETLVDLIPEPDIPLRGFKRNE